MIKGKSLSLKENVNAIKEELSTQEQFLESVIKAEGFWKKYKNIIIAAVAVILIGLIAKGITGYIHTQNIITANKAYNLLLKNSSDTKALALLKSSSPELYSLYLFQNSAQKNDLAALQKSKSEIKDPILQELLTYQINSLDNKITVADTEIAKDFALLQEGYLLLKADKIKEAKAKFSHIEKNSPVRGVVELLNHYQGK